MTVMLPLKNLKFILSWIFSKLLHDSSKLGNADVPASVNVVLKERLSLTNENHGSILSANFMRQISFIVFNLCLLFLLIFFYFLAF